MSPVTHPVLSPGFPTWANIGSANWGLVANSMVFGTPAASQRSRSSVHSFGRYNARSINAWPLNPRYARNTLTWAFSMRPTVPVY